MKSITINIKVLAKAIGKYNNALDSTSISKELFPDSDILREKFETIAHETWNNSFAGTKVTHGELEDESYRDEEQEEPEPEELGVREEIENNKLITQSDYEDRIISLNIF